MKYLIFVLMLCLIGCGSKQVGDTCTDNGKSGLIGSDQSSCMTCPVGVASISGGNGCSLAVNGVYCCITVTSQPTVDTKQYCSTGQCYSFLEGICCAKSEPYACGGKCYSYSGGGSCTSYRTQCY